LLCYGGRVGGCNSSFLRGDPRHFRNEFGMHFQINRPMLHFRTGRIFAQIIVPLPIPGRPDGARDEPAAAVRADIVQQLFGTRCAKGAFITANARLQRIRWQRFVAMFAGWSEFEHTRGELFDRTGVPVKLEIVTVTRGSPMKRSAAVLGRRNAAVPRVEGCPASPSISPFLRPRTARTK